MGWRRMGEAQWPNRKKCPPGCRCGRHKSNPGSFDQNRANVDAGRATRFKPSVAWPSVGDRFGELTVVGFDTGPAGGLSAVIVRCSCGADPHKVQISNLRKGASTRCPRCARAAAAKWRKDYHGYADIVPDVAHRRRLLNRISSCIQRCHNTKNAGYRNYGGRGITVFWQNDKRAFLEHLVTLDGWDNPALELDREDVDRGYEPGNLRFVTRHQNAANRRKHGNMQDEIAGLRREIMHLRHCLRHCSCGAEKPFHDPFR